MTLRITNITRNSILATQAKVAATPDQRRVGLIGTSQRDFGPGSGLYFPECAAIHTFQMSFPIDVLFIDMISRRIVKMSPYLGPGCHFNALLPQDITAALELPAGTIEVTGTRVGDVISVMSSAHCSQEELNRIGAL
jgi:uncharacterized membrane protein (UPF0127 family)